MGLLLGGVPGVAVANVVILGGGIVGTNAARMAMEPGLKRLARRHNVSPYRTVLRLPPWWAAAPCSRHVSGALIYYNFKKR